MSTTYSRWLSENESEYRQLVRKLYHKYSGWHQGIESDELWHTVFIKLSKSMREVSNGEQMARLVCVTARRILCDLSRRKKLRTQYFSTPIPTRGRPLPESTIETVSSKELSPSYTLSVSDEIAAIRSASAKHPKMAEVLKGIEELTAQGLPSSCANIASQLQHPYKQARNELQQFRSFARNVIE